MIFFFLVRKYVKLKVIRDVVKWLDTPFKVHITLLRGNTYQLPTKIIRFQRLKV